MDELEIKEPGREQLIEWEDEFLESLGDHWIGEPASSVEIVPNHAGMNTFAGSVHRFEARISDLDLLVFFKDRWRDILRDYTRDEEFQRNMIKVEERFWDGIRKLPAYLEATYEAVPEEISTSAHMTDMEVENLDSLEGVYQLESFFEDSDSFAFRGVNLDGFAETDSVATAYDILDNSMGVRVGFLYSGDREALEEFNNRSFVEDRSGIPGSAYLGVREKPYLQIDGASEFGLDYSEMEKEVSEGIGEIVLSEDSIEP